MLQGCVTSISGECVEQCHLEHDVEVRDQTAEVIQELYRESIAQRSGLTELTSHLSGRLSKVAKECLTRLGVGLGSRGTDHGVHMCPGCRR